MNARAKSLVIKAQECIDLAQSNISDAKQHELVGYNLAQASEFFLKALCAILELDFPEDFNTHDLDELMELLEENNLTAISSHADIIELTPYNTTNPRIHHSQRLNMNEYLQHVEDLKELVRKHLR